MNEQKRTEYALYMNVAPDGEEPEWVMLRNPFEGQREDQQKGGASSEKKGNPL